LNAKASRAESSGPIPPAAKNASSHARLFSTFVGDRRIASLQEPGTAAELTISPIIASAATAAVTGNGTRTVAGILLAGGLSTRMGGGDKPLKPLGGRPVLAHLIERLKPQAAALAISANGDPARFAAFALPVLADTVAGHAGPLAGILAGMEWAAARPGISHVVSVPADTPFVPSDLVVRLRTASDASRGGVAVASSGGRTHPPIALWPVGLHDGLARFLKEEAGRKVSAFAMRHDPAICPFDPVRMGGSETDPFFNINTPADMEEAERLLAGNLE
jgi:molybdopterin-guanine dinucleotide biosynthesis protein A